MNQQLLQKTYPGEFPRPSAEATFIETEKLLMVVTPWGGKDAAKEMIQTLKDTFAMSSADQEATSPFPKVPTLSVLENNLRSATLQANDVVQRKFNKDQYSSSCEALVIGFDGPQMAWVQVGQPHLLLVRKGELIPLQVALDLSLDYLSPTPLPCKLVGIERQIDLDVRSLTIQPGDQLLMLCRATLPAALFSRSLKGKSPQEVLEILFDACLRANEKAPFWMGLFF